MLPRRAVLSSTVLAACATAGPRPDLAPLSREAVLVAAESWHTDLCLPAASVATGPLAPLGRHAPAAAAFAFGFGLEAWMRAARPGSGEALAAMAGGPAVVVARAVPGPLPPPGAEESVALRVPEGGLAAIQAFILAQLDGPPPAAPPGGAWLLLASSRRYSLDFTCNTWVMAGLAAAGLPVPVAGIRFRGESMRAVRTEATRQATAG
ncbi:DUF2459 domain-containing protein [Neoroseomonas lacus]|nr:DUF2459 domain-containing protein [Neoroseomonas lacus]